MKRHILLACIAALIIAGLAAYGVSHAHLLDVLAPRGPVGAAERRVMLTALLLPAVVVIPVFVLLFFFAWKYRARGPAAREKHLPDWDHDNWIAEAVWWLVPGAVIAILAVILWRSAHTLDPYKPLPSSQLPLTVEVVALDWKWLFIYPEQGVASVNELELPVGRPVHFELTADAPMNSFWIPSLGGQIMAMPGMETRLNLMASEQGSYDGFSANISGKGFSSMHFKANAVSDEAFATWVAHAKESGQSLTPASYLSLSKPSIADQVSYFGAVDPNLFMGVIMNSMMPGMLTASSSQSSTSSAQEPMGMPGMDMSNMQM